MNSEFSSSFVGASYWRAMLIVLAGLTLSSCGGGGGGGSGGSSITVPNVIGETQSAASATIAAADLTLGAVSSQSSTTVPSGSVVSENPAAGGRASSGSAVNLVVSSGPPQVVVPNVVGATQSIATTAIANAGLVAGAITMQASATVPNGAVISENPTAGTSVNSGSAINIVISSGPPLKVNFQVTYDAVNDAVWDPQSQLLYLAIGSAGLVFPNSLVGFDPQAGKIVSSAFAGSEPTTLAVSDDGQFLYVGLRGANEIRRFSLPSLAPNLDFPSDADEFAPGSSGGAPLFPLQIAVAPGAAHSIAVSRSVSFGSVVPFGYSNTEVRPGAALVFDDAVSRPYPQGASPNAQSVTWGASASILYTGFNSAQGTQVEPVSTANGEFTPGQTIGNMPGTFPDVIGFANGLIYDNSGAVLDPNSNSIVRTLPGASGIFVPDLAGNRIFFAHDDGTFSLSAYDLNQGTLLGSVASLGSQVHGPSKLIRWGVDGLAMVTVGGELTVFWGSLIAPGGTDNPVGTLPIDSPKTPTLLTPAVTILSLQASDVAWDAIHRTLYAYIPSGATEHPNTIAVINPVSGLVTAYVSPTSASTPGAIAISDDGQYLYVAEVGSYDRFLLPNMTLDAHIAVGGNWGGGPIRLAVAPGSPHTFAGNFAGQVAVFDESGPVGLAADGGVTVWGPTASTLYSWNNTLNVGSLFNYAVSSAGLTQTGMIVGDRFVTLNPFKAQMGMFYANGLLYADSGAIVNPQNGQTVGTLPLAGPSDAQYAVGPIVVDIAKNRAYAMTCEVFPVNSACGNELISFDLTTYVPMARGGIPGFSGYAFRIFELSPTAFASLGSNGDVAIVSDPGFAQ